jgi:hypothetical protein
LNSLPICLSFSPFLIFFVILFRFLLKKPFPIALLSLFYVIFFHFSPY